MTSSSLLAAIRAFPKEDGPRLILADWYDHQGDVRGRFIRLQLERASLEGKPTSVKTNQSRIKKLLEEETNLLQEYEKSWLSEYGLWKSEVEWNRGIAETIVLPWERLWQVGEEVLVNVPAVTLRLIGKNHSIKRLLRLPGLQYLTHLDLTKNSLEYEEIIYLANSPSVSSLHTLVLARNSTGPQGAEILAKSETLTQLTRLDLSFNSLGPRGATQFAQSCRLPMLGELNLANNAIGTAGAEAVVKSTICSQLTELDLSENGIEKYGFEAIYGVSRWPNLQKLVLRGNNFWQVDIRALKAKFGDKLVLGP